MSQSTKTIEDFANREYQYGFVTEVEDLVRSCRTVVEFADRLYKHLFNDGPLTDPNSQVRWLEVNQGLDRAIVGESARWGDARYDAPITPEHWLKARDNVLAQMEGNAAKLIRLTRAQGYYPIIDPPGFSQHGGVVTSGYQLNMTPADGTIYYTTDGSDHIT